MSQPELNKSEYRVEACKFHVVKPWIMHKHYAKRCPSVSFAFGLYRKNENNLLGICTFGNAIPMQMRRGVCGIDYSDFVYELNRVCLEEGMPKNTASFLVSKSLRLLPRPKIIVSYSDMAQSHHGYIYQACNFIYTGKAHTQKDVKIRGREHLHSRTIMDEFGRVRNRVKLLKEKYGDDFYYEQRPVKHRYVYFCGENDWVERAKSCLKYSKTEYPKGDNKRYVMDRIPEFCLNNE